MDWTKYLECMDWESENNRLQRKIISFRNGVVKTDKVVKLTMFMSLLMGIALIFNANNIIVTIIVVSWFLLIVCIERRLSIETAQVLSRVDTPMVGLIIEVSDDMRNANVLVNGGYEYIDVYIPLDYEAHVRDLLQFTIEEGKGVLSVVPNIYWNHISSIKENKVWE